MKSMQGTPWHIGFTKTQEGDPRRHRSNCKSYNFEKKRCTNRKSLYWDMHCGGSAHCDYYEKANEDEINDRRRRKRLLAEERPKVIKKNVPEHELVKENDKIEILNDRTRVIAKYRVAPTGLHKKYPPLVEQAIGKQLGEEFRYRNVKYKIVSITR
ncbi:MAG: hypothetical protein Q4G58_05215, partial [bacterium]|nr:hypothetical protein [bacterium]